MWREEVFFELTLLKGFAPLWFFGSFSKDECMTDNSSSNLSANWLAFNLKGKFLRLWELIYLTKMFITLHVSIKRWKSEKQVLRRYFILLRFLIYISSFMCTTQIKDAYIFCLYILSICFVISKGSNFFLIGYLEQSKVTKCIVGSLRREQTLHYLWKHVS